MPEESALEELLALAASIVPVKQYQRASVDGKTYTVNPAQRGAPGPKNGITNPGGAIRSELSTGRQANQANQALDSALGSSNTVTVGGSTVGRTAIAPPAAAPMNHPAVSSSVLSAGVKAAEAGVAANQANVSAAAARQAAATAAQVKAAQAVAAAKAKAAAAAKAKTYTPSTATPKTATTSSSSTPKMPTMPKLPTVPRVPRVPRVGSLGRAVVPNRSNPLRVAERNARNSSLRSEKATSDVKRAAEEPKKATSDVKRAAEEPKRAESVERAKTDFSSVERKGTTPIKAALGPRDYSLAPRESAERVSRPVARAARPARTYVSKLDSARSKGDAAEHKASLLKAHAALGLGSSERHAALEDAARLRHEHLTGEHHTPEGFHELLSTKEGLDSLKDEADRGLKLSMEQILGLQVELTRAGFRVPLDGKLSEELVAASSLYLRGV